MLFTFQGKAPFFFTRVATISLLFESNKARFIALLPPPELESSQRHTELEQEERKKERSHSRRGPSFPPLSNKNELARLRE